MPKAKTHVRKPRGRIIDNVSWIDSPTRLHDGVADFIGDPSDPPVYLGHETLHHLPGGKILMSKPLPLAKLVDQFAVRKLVYFRVMPTRSSSRVTTICIEGVIHARVITQFGDITDDSKPLECKFQRCTCKDFWAVLGKGLLKALKARIREPAKKEARKRARTARR